MQWLPKNKVKAEPGWVLFLFPPQSSEKKPKWEEKKKLTLTQIILFLLLHNGVWTCFSWADEWLPEAPPTEFEHVLSNKMMCLPGFVCYLAT